MPLSCTLLQIASQKSTFESGYFKSGPSSEFLPKFTYFSRKCLTECPLFFQETIHSRGHEKIIIFPLAVPLLNILSPKCGQIPQKVANFKGGGFWRKRSNARGNLTKTSGMTYFIFLKSLGYTTSLIEEKIRFQNSKFPNITLI